MPAERAEGLTRSSTEETDAVISSVDELAHLWSRPVPDEVMGWWRDLAIVFWNPSSVDDALELLREHDRLFLGPGEPPCPPYESHWKPAPQSTVDLAAIYRSIGLQVRRPLIGLPDHLAVEFEAVACALSSDRTQSVARRLFLDHLELWVPTFCRAVATETRHFFYRELAEATAETMKMLRTYFSDVPAEDQ